MPRGTRLKDIIRKFGTNHNKWIERIVSEIQFAEMLDNTVRKRKWSKQIDKAIKFVEDKLMEKTDIEKIVSGAEEILSPIGNEAKKFTIHCIGHSHIDMNWMWSWQETVAITVDTFRTVLSLMDEFPEFKFVQSQGSVYKIAKDFAPDVFERIKEKVKSGQWEIAACHWVEGDKNLVLGESLVRHLLYTRRFIENEFGLKSEDVPVDWEPDTFGHACTIPSIVSGGGVKYYYMCRGGTKTKEPIFWWEGSDGSRVLVNREINWYNGTIEPEIVRYLLEFYSKTGFKDWLCVFGVGDHGGGPTRRDLKQFREMRAWPIFPNLKFTLVKDYFKLIEEKADKVKIPIIKDELNFEFTGCYTSQSRIKQANRIAENHLVESEIFSTLANILFSHPYRDEHLRKGWINTLFGHFHDILPGSGVRETREYQLGLFQETIAYADQAKLSSLRKFARNIDTSFGGKVRSTEEVARGYGAGVGKGVEEFELPQIADTKSLPAAFVIFNPTGNPRNEVVKLTLWDIEEMEEDEFVGKFDGGRVIPLQKVNSGEYWQHRFVEFLVPVEVKELSYNTIVVDKLRNNEKSKRKSNIKYYWSFNKHRAQYEGRYIAENEYIKFEVDKLTGGVKSLIDKQTGAELADSLNPLGVLEYIIERPRNMSAWVLNEPRKYVPVEVIEVTPEHEGSYLVAIKCEFKFGNSEATIRYTLKENQKQVGIDVDLRWYEVGNENVGTPALRLKFPFNLNNPVLRCEVPFGWIERKLNDGSEVPALRWVDVYDRKSGCLVLNDCKYGYSLTDSILRINLIRSSYEPDVLPEGGKYRFRFAVMPHKGKLVANEAIRVGMDFNHPLVVIPTDIHKGKLLSMGKEFIKIDKPNVIVAALKKSEDEEGIILRVVEAEGKKTACSINFDTKLWAKIRKVHRVNLTERKLNSSHILVRGNKISVNLRPYEIMSLLIKF